MHNYFKQKVGYLIMIEIRTHNSGKNVLIVPSVYKNMSINDVEILIYENGEWGYGDEFDSKEIGAYTTWCDNPSNSVMLHYQIVDDSEVEWGLVREQGTTEWQTELFCRQAISFNE